jgi:hypothetical protein
MALLCLLRERSKSLKAASGAVLRRGTRGVGFREGGFGRTEVSSLPCVSTGYRGVLGTKTLKEEKQEGFGDGERVPLKE